MSEIELKPCPFCGGEAHLFAMETIGTGVAYFVRCVGNKSKCAGPIRTKYCDTEERAVEVWNRRAERTCHVIPDGCMGRCSACGDDVFADPNHKGGYCPSCGAEVVE